MDSIFYLARFSLIVVKEIGLHVTNTMQIQLATPDSYRDKKISIDFSISGIKFVEICLISGKKNLIHFMNCHIKK
jgi:hypothetical protein